MKRWAVGMWLSLASMGVAAEPSAERGKELLLGKSYNPPMFTRVAYDNMWKQWGLTEKPKDFDRVLRERYGFHAAPYPNGDLPMGLREQPLLLGVGKGVGNDCLICHGGSIAGQSYVGLGNSSLDYQTFYEEAAAADGRPKRTAFTFCNVRGTNEAGGMAVFLLSFRNPDLSLRSSRLDFDLRDDLCEDVPAWWLLKKKKTMYYTGGGDQRSVRSLMQFMMDPRNLPADFERAEEDFKHIRAFLLSLEAPKYPLSINKELAKEGEDIFASTCARCHGTYGPKWTYPNKVVPLKDIGTDPRRYEGISRKFGEYFDKTWFASEYRGIDTAGYQAPPLDGIWATAPYFHNGSAPTVYHVLNSKARPKLFTRSYRTDLDAYDPVHLGWKIEALKEAPDSKKLTPLELRKIYDTTQSGRGNGGHTFGDALSDKERMAVIEYLKTL